jgi:hypothetical protein
VLPYLQEQGGLLATERAPVAWRAIRRGVPAPPADLLVIGCSRRRALSLPRTRSVVLPFRIRMVLDIAGDARTVLSTVSRKQRQEFARQRRASGWACEISERATDLEFFYRRMHLPTMAARHGSRTRSADWDLAVHALLRNGFLLFVTEHGARVAGALCRWEGSGSTVRIRLVGVLDGAAERYRGGALKAVFFLATEWAADNGVRRLDFAGGDPYPGQGVFQFKRRFHPAVLLPDDHFADRRVYLRVGRDTPEVRDFLVATPLLTVDAAGGLAATYFHDAARPARTDIRADCPGIAGSRLIDLDEFLADPGATSAASAYSARQVSA